MVHKNCIGISGGSRGGARGARPPPSLFWVKEEEMTEGKMADRASKSRPPPPPPPLAQGLDPPLGMENIFFVSPAPFFPLKRSVLTKNITAAKMFG